VIDVPDLEEVVHQVLLGVLRELLLERPEVLLRAQVAVVVVEALDEALAEPVAVLGPRVPEGDVRVDDEVLLAVLLVHGLLLPSG
jgi:hypothetical protein